MDRDSLHPVNLVKVLIGGIAVKVCLSLTTHITQRFFYCDGANVVLTRDEFKIWVWDQYSGHQHQESIIKDSSPLWIPERDQIKCQYFVKTKPVESRYKLKKNDYWDWCRKNIRADVKCFWSNQEDHEEWWGFTDYDDIMLWILKWSQ